MDLCQTHCKTHVAFPQFLPSGQYGLCFCYCFSGPLPLRSHHGQVTLWGACFRDSLVIRLYSGIGQIHLSIEGQGGTPVYLWVTATGGSSQNFLIGFQLDFYNDWMQLENTNKIIKRLWKSEMVPMVPIYVRDFGQHGNAGFYRGPWLGRPRKQKKDISLKWSDRTWLYLCQILNRNPDRSGVYRQCSCSVCCMYTAGTLQLAGSVCAVYKNAGIGDHSTVYLQCTLPNAVYPQCIYSVFTV